MYPKTFIKEIFSSLPDEIMSVNSSEETLSAIEAISTTYNLDHTAWQALQFEVTLLLIGLTPQNSFASILESKLHVTSTTASLIAKGVREQIVTKIPEKILQAQEEYAQAKLKELSFSEKAALPANSSLNTVGKAIQIIEVPDNLPSVPPQSAPHAVEPEVSATIQAPIATPASSAEVEGEGAKAVSTPVRSSAPIHDALNLIGSDRPSDEAKDDRPIATKPSSYAPGKDPYREPLE